MAKINKNTIIRQIKARVDGLSDSASISSVMFDKMTADGALDHALHVGMRNFALMVQPGQIPYLITTADGVKDSSYHHGIDVYKLPDDRLSDREDGGIVKIILDGIERSPELGQSIESLSALAKNTYISSMGHHSVDILEGVAFVLCKGDEVKFKYVKEPTDPAEVTEIDFDFRYMERIVDMAVMSMLNQFSVPGLPATDNEQTEARS